METIGDENSAEPDYVKKNSAALKLLADKCTKYYIRQIGLNQGDNAIDRAMRHAMLWKLPGTIPT
jgi:hypothetical protein